VAVYHALARILEARGRQENKVMKRVNRNEFRSPVKFLERARLHIIAYCILHNAFFFFFHFVSRYDASVMVEKKRA
jgi:hypothetical protein